MAFFIAAMLLGAGCSHKNSGPAPTTTGNNTGQNGTSTKPAAPTGLEAYAGNGSVTLTFTPSTGATGYNVYESSSSGGPYNRIDTTANIYYTLQGLQKGPTYYFVVTAGNDAGESGYSNEVSSTAYVISRLYGVGKYPADIAMDASGNLWVANYGSADVTELSPSGSVIGTYPAGNQPIAIAIAPSGKVWVVNQGSNTVTELGPDGSRKGDYPTGQRPDALAIDLMANIWIANSNDNTVTVLSPSGTTVGTYPAGGMPTALAVDKSYNIWIADWSSNTLAQMDRNGSLISTYTSGMMPSCIRVAPSGDLWVTNWWDNTVTRLAPDGSTIGTYTTGSRPRDIAIDSLGNVYITNSYDNTVSVLTATGLTIGTYPAGANPAGIVIDAQGNVWVTNQTNNSLTELVGIAQGAGTGAMTKPSPPSNLTANLSSSQVMLSWSPSGGAGNYNVYESTAPGGPYTLLGITGSTSYSVSGLSKETVYYFVVTAINASAESWYSNEVTVIIYLSSPTGLSATSADREVTLLWNGVLGASGYNVYTSTVSGGTYTKVGATGALHFSITGLITGTTYYCAVTAYNDAGESAKSSSVSATPEYPTSIPSPPAGLAAVVVNTDDVTLTWLPTPGATSYNIYDALTGKLISTTDDITYLVKDQTRGSTDSFTATSANVLGESGASASVSVTIIPSPPQGLTATPTSGGVTLTWSKSDGGSSYNVYEATQYGGPYTRIGSTSTQTFSIVGLTNNALYYFGVTAVDSAGESDSLSVVRAVPEETHPTGNGPINIAIDAYGHLWITNNTDGSVTVLNGSGDLFGTFNAGAQPKGIAIDAANDAWVVSRWYNRVIELNASGSILAICNTGFMPEDIMIDASGNLWVVNNGNNDVTVLGPACTTRGTYPAGNEPDAIAIDNAGNAWVTDEGSNRVTELNPYGSAIGTFTTGTMPDAIAIDPSGNVWVANWWDNTVTKLSPAGSFKGTFRTGGGPARIAIDANGNVWITNEKENTVSELAPDGSTVRTYFVSLSPLGIAIDGSGNVWVANEGANNITRMAGMTAGPQYFPVKGPLFP